ncbi:DUF1343 domain-containing protein [Membranicola marinus]|uniref:DUF1343 domain-containing protein n=1 Tax=Membranihabitans marinus TaxID=1227546 RepID=A0A953L823_9BACT|nr:DUF1343 domain-containing protein [Membranihabitans marinus]MBY5959337.1 DUF1343 domain-containing protein [Membranihabitans marinus]
MKLYFLFLISWVFIGFSTAHSQTIDGKPIAEIEGAYLEVVLSNQLFGGQVRVMVDYGQLNNPWIFKRSQVKDSNGQEVRFHSLVEVLNYFHQFDYKLVSSLESEETLARYVLYRDPNRNSILYPSHNVGDKGQLVKTGADQLEKYLPLLRGKKVGILGNQTSVVGDRYHHLVDVLLENDIDVRFAFAPEHGFRGKIERGEKVSKDVDVKTGITLHSLYGKNAKADSIVASADIMIYDLQDVGARFYTYITSLHRLMQLCVDVDRPLLVLDRPNPNGDQVNGPVRKSDKFKSNVSYHKIAMVHGLTVGELAHMINGEGWLDGGAQCDVTVIPVEGYTHATFYEPPVIPSPSLPNYLSIRLYPSLCLFEGTDISVARGTDFPFQAIGYANPVFGDFTFVPGSREGMSAHVEQQGKKCYGVDLRDVDAEKWTFNLRHFIDFYQKAPFKESFFSRPEFFDKLAGNDTLRKKIKEGWSYDQIEASWQDELDAYKKMRKKYLLYEDFD